MIMNRDDRKPYIHGYPWIKFVTDR